MNHFPHCHARTRRALTRQALAGVTALCYVLALPGMAMAGPEGGQVAEGSASITQSGTTTIVEQRSNRALLDWRRFNLSAQESTQFMQPSATSVAVNRIHDAAPSRIEGALSANGQVVLINPNGIVFAPGSRVDVQSLIAASASPTEAEARDWARHRRDDLPLSQAGSSQALILNQGRITAGESGLVGLVAPQVVNDGVIAARMGKVHLASGDTATLDLAGDGLINVAVSDATTKQLAANHGLIQADGGTVLMTAAAGSHVAAGIINMDGVIQARSLGNKQGRILLQASGSNAVAGNVTAAKGKKAGRSSVTVSGQLDASGREAGERGGAISITGDEIALTPTAKLTTSGTQGGGTILIGGDKQGQGTTPTARQLNVAQGAILEANAMSAGDGGRIILWADGGTNFAGRISAKGGAHGGKGGFVETSGRETLRVTGAVDLTSMDGQTGTWLLDPTDITIYNRSGSGDGTNTFTAAQLETMSSGADVVLNASNNITLDLTGDTVTLTNNRSLTLTAGAQILTASLGGITTSGNGGITFNAPGGITLSHALTLNAGSGGIALNNAVSSSADQIFTTTGTFTNASTMAMGAHSLTLISNDVVVGGALSGTGTLAFRPYNSGASMRLNFYSGDYNLDSTELGRLADGWSIIEFGRTDGQNNLSYGGGSFTDPITFRSYGVGVFGNMTGTGNAAFSFMDGGTTYYNNSSMSTQGGAISFSNTLTFDSNGGSIATNGGALTLSGGAAISNGTGFNVSLDSGAGLTTFGSTVNGDFNLTSNAGSYSFNGAWGGSTALRTVSLTSANTSFTLPNMTTTGNVTLNAGTGTITTGSITTGTGNLSIQSDNITIGGDLTGSSTLLLRPTSNLNMRINWFSGDYDIDSAELAHIKDGWSGITLGHAGVGSVTMGSATWTDNVTIVKNSGGFSANQIFGAQTMTGGANFTTTSAYVDVFANITTDGGAATINGVTTTYNNSVISTNGGTVTLNGDARVNAGASGLNVNSGGGAINLTGAIFDINGSTAGMSVVLNAGSGALTIGGDVNGGYDLTATAGSMSLSGIWGGTTPLGAVSLVSTASLSAPSISASSILARATGASADLTIGAGKTLSASGAGNALVLSAGRNFLNQAGAGALALTGAGRWLVYSTNPTGTTGEESLSNDFNRYSCSYTSGGACAGGTILVPSSGNGLLYAYTPTLTATPSLQTLTYGDAATLAGYAYALTGYLGTDGAADTVGGSLTGSSAYAAGANVGTYGLTYASGTLTSALGYGFTYASNASALQVGTRTVTASLIGTVSKSYDGTTIAVPLGTNYALANLYGSDALTVTASGATYNNASVGSGKSVAVVGLSLSGAKATNYTLASTTTSAAVGTILARALTVAAQAAQKDAGAADPALLYSYSGQVSGETPLFSGALARQAGEEAGSYAILQGDLAALGNYTIGSFSGANFTVRAKAVAPPPSPAPSNHALPKTVEPGRLVLNIQDKQHISTNAHGRIMLDGSDPQAFAMADTSAEPEQLSGLLSYSNELKQQLKRH